MKKILITLFAFLMPVMANTAFAQKKSDRTVHIPLVKPGENSKIVLPVPGPGENITVIVDVPVLKPRKAAVQRKVIYLPTRIVEVQQGSGLHLRGGLTTEVGAPGRQRASFTGGLIGEIGYADSPWSLQGTFRAGNCKDGNVAINSGLAAMRSVHKYLRVGLGADLLYCSDVSSHPKEKADERIVGGSLRLEIELSHIVMGGSIGVGAATVPVPGDRETQPALYGGLNVSYLWGR